MSQPVSPSTSGAGPPGRVVGLIANYFRVETDDAALVHDFRVDFEPEVESVGRRRELIAKVADRFKTPNGRTPYLYDGMHNLKALSPIDLAQETIVIRVPGTAVKSEDDGGDGLPGDQEIRLKRGETPVNWGSLEMMRLYNMLMRSSLHKHLKWISIMRYFYDPATEKRMDPHPVSLIHGMATAANQHKSGILMACDSITKLLRAEHVIDVMKKIRSKDPDCFPDNCKRELPGCVVITRYGTKQSYRIDDIAFGMNPKSTFERKGETITFVKYFKEQYDIVIQDERQPLLVKMPSQKTVRNMERRGLTASNIYLIPELCVMTGLSEELRANMDLKKQLTQSTQLAPQQRIEKLREFRAKLDDPGIQSDMEDWNLKYSKFPVHLPGRVLDNERMLMRSQQSSLEWQLKNPGDFSSEIRNNAMRDSSKCWKELTVIFRSMDTHDVTEFLDFIRKSVNRLGLASPAPHRISLGDDRIATIKSVLTRLNHRPDHMVMCIFSGNDKKRYDEIKKFCCTESPCTSQVVRSQTLKRKQNLPAIATNVVLQMACKVGSVPWSLKMSEENVMVVGYDSYRDPELHQTGGGFVCSLNQDHTRYFSRASYHKDWVAMSKNIALHLYEGLIKYKEVNGQFPDRVVVYRAGVGEGMIRHVMETEVAGMIGKIQELDKNIKLAVVIVSKRTNAKFFLKREVDGKRSVVNPPPGTVIDTVITRPDPVDEFYLISQSVRHGTASPTNYNIICNTTGWQSPVFQTMAYKLCHLYFNWQGTIRVPAPCQYAHKLAFLTCTSLHRDPHPDLSDRLFFL